MMYLRQKIHNIIKSYGVQKAKADESVVLYLANVDDNSKTYL